jgi:4-hydroxy-tetrahydrodipicolinate synthase
VAPHDAALITRFDDDGEIDVVAHAHNVSVANAVGARGVLIAGSTGEGPYLEPGERTTLVAAARAPDADITIICGISAESDRQALRQIHDAANGGANAALVATPGTLVRNRMHQRYHRWWAIEHHGSYRFER